MRAKLTAIHLYPAKGQPGMSPANADLTVKDGLVGEMSHRPEMQIALVAEEALKPHPRGTTGLCQRRFKANLVIAGWDRLDPQAGDQLTIGTATISLTSVGKDCYPECPLFQETGPCALATGVAFGQTFTDGKIRIGDEVSRRRLRTSE